MNTKERFVIRARSPKGNVLYYTVKKTFATRGRLQHFVTMDSAFRKAVALMNAYPILREYNLHAEPMRDPGESGMMKRLKKFESKRNPSGFAKARDGMLAEMDEAADAYEGFTGRRATKEVKYSAPDFKTGFAMGELVAVVYRPTPQRDGDKTNTIYTHEFRKNSRPLLISKHDGTQLAIVGGQFQVTERGIEDKP